jgi:hypothetical protein
MGFAVCVAKKGRVLKGEDMGLPKNGLPKKRVGQPQLCSPSSIKAEWSNPPKSAFLVRYYKLSKATKSNDSVTYGKA